MKFPLRFLFPLAAAATLSVPPTLAAADAVEPSKVTVTTATEPKMLNLDFPGGPLGALVALMSRDNSGFNVVGEKADLNVELPPFVLRNANPAAVANAVGGILMPRGYVLQSAGGIAVGQLPVYYLRKLMPNEIQPGLSQFQSFQLGPYLEQQSVDDIVGAIRAAWELCPDGRRHRPPATPRPPTRRDRRGPRARRMGDDVSPERPGRAGALDGGRAAGARIGRIGRGARLRNHFR